MSVEVSENTEITLSLRSIGAIIFVVFALSSVIVRYETKVSDLEDEIEKLKEHIQRSSQELRNASAAILEQQMNFIKLQKDVEYIGANNDGRK